MRRSSRKLRGRRDPSAVAPTSRNGERTKRDSERGVEPGQLLGFLRASGSRDRDGSFPAVRHIDTSPRRKIGTDASSRTWTRDLFTRDVVAGVTFTRSVRQSPSRCAAPRGIEHKQLTSSEADSPRRGPSATRHGRCRAGDRPEIAKSACYEHEANSLSGRGGCEDTEILQPTAQSLPRGWFKIGTVRGLLRCTSGCGTRNSARGEELQ
jgi:hypothetical protein